MKIYISSYLCSTIVSTYESKGHSMEKGSLKLQDMTPKTYTKACGHLCMYILVVSSVDYKKFK